MALIRVSGKGASPHQRRDTLEIKRSSGKATEENRTQRNCKVSSKLSDISENYFGKFFSRIWSRNKSYLFETQHSHCKTETTRKYLEIISYNIFHTNKQLRLELHECYIIVCHCSALYRCQQSCPIERELTFFNIPHVQGNVTATLHL